MSLDPLNPSQLSVELEARRKVQFNEKKNDVFVFKKTEPTTDYVKERAKDSSSSSAVSVKELTKNSPSSDFSGMSCFQLFLKVYALGAKFIYQSIAKENVSLCGRVCLFIKGLLLILPVINTVSYVAFHYLEQREGALPRQQKEPKSILKKPQAETAPVETTPLKPALKQPKEEHKSTAGKVSFEEKLPNNVVQSPEQIRSLKNKGFEKFRPDLKENIPSNNLKQNTANPASKIKEAKQQEQRRFPPFSMVDTIGKEGRRDYKAPSYRDDEILEKVPFKDKRFLFADDPRPLSVRFTESHKAIVLQQGKRACTAAVTAMLIIDHGKEPNIAAVRSRNLGFTETMVSDISEAGLLPIVTELKLTEAEYRAKDKRRILKELIPLIKSGGSAIVSVDSGLGGHVVVLDELTDKYAAIRDPYHGWKIKVKRDAFDRSFEGGSVIQVRSKNLASQANVKDQPANQKRTASAQQGKSSSNEAVHRFSDGTPLIDRTKNKIVSVITPEYGDSLASKAQKKKVFVKGNDYIGLKGKRVYFDLEEDLIFSKATHTESVTVEDIPGEKPGLVLITERETSKKGQRPITKDWVVNTEKSYLFKSPIVPGVEMSKEMQDVWSTPIEVYLTEDIRPQYKS